jgi:hypothetical protein
VVRRRYIYYHTDLVVGDIRAFEGIVNDDKMFIKKYPEDFSLYYIGNLGDSDGRYYIENCDESRIPVMVGRAIEYVQVDNGSTK